MKKVVFIISFLTLFSSACKEDPLTPPPVLAPEITLIQAPAEVYQFPAAPAGIHVRASQEQGDGEVVEVTLTVSGLSGSRVAIHAMVDDGANGDILASDAQFFLPIDTALTHSQTGAFILEAVAMNKIGATSPPKIDTLTILPGVENRLPMITSVNAPQVVWSDSNYAPQFLASATDPDGINSIKFVVLEIYPPAFPKPSQLDTLHDDGNNGDGAAGDGTFGLKLNPSRLGNQCGLFSMAFRPVDETGGVGAAALQTLRVTQVKLANNHPPELSSLIAPTTISRSATPNNYVLSVQASDPDAFCGDGIASVFFKSFRPDGTPANNGNPFTMRDDGREGDQVAGDGRYSLTIEITPANATGAYRFEFEAQDRNGAHSEKLVHTINVTP